jgi:hypothetical protein
MTTYTRLHYIVCGADTLALEFAMAGWSLITAIWLLTPLAHRVFELGLWSDVALPHVMGIVLFGSAWLKLRGVLRMEVRIRGVACAMAFGTWLAITVQLGYFAFVVHQGTLVFANAIGMTILNAILAYRLLTTKKPEGQIE